MTKFLSGAGAYIVLTFAIAFLWNMVLFREAYVALAAQSLRTEPIMPLGFASILIQAGVMAFVFSRFHDGSLSQGMMLALVLGAFNVTYAALVVPAKFTIEPISQYVLLEVAFGLLHYTAVGVALTFVFRRS